MTTMTIRMGATRNDVNIMGATREIPTRNQKNGAKKQAAFRKGVLDTLEHYKVF